MKKALLIVLAIALAPFSAFAVDGVVLINQSTVLAAGGFPYNIATPGSYKLSGNLIVQQAGVSGIQISASNVTLDLNGFMISGPPCTTAFCALTSSGITVPNVQTSIIVRNGTISGFGSQLSLFLATCLAEDLILRSVPAPGGALSRNSAFGVSSIVRHVITDGQLEFNCPAIGIENSATFLVRDGVATSCFILSNLGTVI